MNIIRGKGKHKQLAVALHRGGTWEKMKKPATALRAAIAGVFVWGCVDLCICLPYERAAGNVQLGELVLQAGKKGKLLFLIHVSNRRIFIQIQNRTDILIVDETGPAQHNRMRNPVVFCIILDRGEPRSLSARHQNYR